MRQGGESSVVKTETNGSSYWAIKQPKSFRDVTREIEVLLRLNPAKHMHLALLNNVLRDRRLPGVPFLVTEWADKSDLNALPQALKDMRAGTDLPRGVTPLLQTLQVALQILRGLDSLHSLHYAHLDLKPHNILLYTHEQHQLFVPLVR